MNEEIDLSKADYVDLKGYQRDSFIWQLTVKDTGGTAVNLSSFTTAKMSLRETEYGDPTVTFHSTGTTHTIKLAGLATGNITVSASTLNITPTTYLYDLQLSSATRTETVAYGKLKVIPDITT